MAELTRPTETHPNDVVENVYQPPFVVDTLGVVHPDIHSKERMTDYLERRMEPDQGIVRGGLQRIAIGTKNVTRYAVDRMWYWGMDRKGYVALSLGLLVGSNIIANSDEIRSATSDTIEAAQGFKDGVEDGLHIGEYTDDCAVRTEETTHETETVIFAFNDSGTNQPSGESQPNLSTIDEILDTITQRQAAGYEQTHLKVGAFASDDYLTAENLGFGHEDEGNSGVDGIAAERLEDFKTALEFSAEVRGVDLTNVSYEYDEVVLPLPARMAILNAATENGYSVEDALLAYKNDRASLADKGALLLVLDDNIGANRGNTVEAEFSRITPGDTVVTCTEKKFPDGKPENENNPYDAVFIPAFLLPIPLLTKKIMEKVRCGWINVPDDMPDPEFLKLYPEAKDQYNQLVDGAFKYVRKYQHLMREDGRIPEAYWLDFENENDDHQRLNAMFIDHVPTQESRDMVAKVFKIAAQMTGGRIAKDLKMVAIYPSGNAGMHGDAKRIGLGQDIQYEKDMLGVAIPALGLVEMHMPTVDQDQRDSLQGFKRPEWVMAYEIAKGFMGPEWVLAHEAPGHFTDLNQESNQLRAIGMVGNTTIWATNNRFEDSMADIHKKSEAEERQIGTFRGRVRRAVDALRDNDSGRFIDTRWRIFRGIENQEGQVQPMDTEVDTTDPRLTEAQRTRKQTGPVTKYGGTNPAETYAESAAQMVTGIEIPFNQAKDGAGVRPQAGFAQGYAVADRSHDFLAERWGSDPNAWGVRFLDEEGNERVRTDFMEWSGRPQDDADLHEMIQEARSHPVPRDEDLLHILTGKRIEKAPQISESDRAKKILV